MANSKNKSFLRRNLVYIVIAVLMLAMAGIGIAFLVKETNNLPVSNITADTNKKQEQKDDKDTEKQEEKDIPTPITDPEPEQPKPVKPSVFVMPVEDGTVTTAYTKDTVVFNSTLNAYTGHMGVDVVGADDANVLCAYDGTVESIVTTYLAGATVTIDHGFGIKTVYNSIEVDENLTEGQSLKAGDVIGTVSTTNKQEYKSGAHLHFEVYENGVRIDPEVYLPEGNK